MSQIEKKRFYELDPNQMIQAVEEAGFFLTGEYIQLNSYENRVFDFYLESEKIPPEHVGLNQRVIAKFYRPGRWSKESILSEHEFLKDLKTEGVPVVAPISLSNLSTVYDYKGIFLSIFPKGWGRLPQELDLENLKSIGRVLAHIHNVGEKKEAPHRLTLNTQTYGDTSLEILLPWIPEPLKERYLLAAENLLDHLDDLLDPSEFIRIHGDCHKGNILEYETPKKKLYYFMDFDDFCNGPVAQDFWMLFSDKKVQKLEMEAILSGYEELRHFPKHQMNLFEPLRGLRLIHYSAWIAKRYDDPCFQQTFPQFIEQNYWYEEVMELESILRSL